MPIYEFKCDECGDITEKYFTHAGDLAYAILSCYKRHCHGIPRKIMSAPKAHFKGSGFYQTDYKDKT